MINVLRQWIELGPPVSTGVDFSLAQCHVEHPASLVELQDIVDNYIVVCT